MKRETVCRNCKLLYCELVVRKWYYHYKKKAI